MLFLSSRLPNHYTRCEITDHHISTEVCTVNFIPVEHTILSLFNSSKFKLIPYLASHYDPSSLLYGFNHVHLLAIETLSLFPSDKFMLLHSLTASFASFDDVNSTKPAHLDLPSPSKRSLVFTGLRPTSLKSSERFFSLYDCGKPDTNTLLLVEVLPPPL